MKTIIKPLLVTSAILAFSIPLFIALRTISTGNIPFWYDNARDMLSAWDNLQKPTLIGPPTGIPGIFYGPYWIWLLSIGVFFSKDPRIATIVVGVIPYFIVFPYVLSTFSKIFKTQTIIVIWLLFIYSTGFTYATNMWNPHIAPLIFLGLVSMLLFTDFFHNNISSYFKTFLVGIFSGLIINFHMSFGIGVFVGTCLFFLIHFVMHLKKNTKAWKKLALHACVTFSFFLFGAAIVFTPFFLFETRHGFNQTKIALSAFTQYGGVVTLKGLSKTEILTSFFGKSTDLLHGSGIFLQMLEILTLLYVFVIWKRKTIQFSDNEKKLITLLSALSIGILFIYLTAKNPVWSYHFIAIEIIFLLLIGLIMNKISFIRYCLTIWVFVFVSLSVISFVKNAGTTNLYALPTLITKNYIVDTIAKDAGSNISYAVFNYSPSIYQYEYTYLFRWKYVKDVPYDPGIIPSGNKVVYLIIPPANANEQKNFITYRTSNTQYTTTKMWKIPDGTVILKRERI